MPGRLRKTPQLDAIEGALRAAPRPLAVTEVHAAAEKSLSGLGIATVYRTLAALVEAGKIVTVVYPGQPTRYEWAVAQHHSHFICNNCRRVYDIEAPDDVPKPKRRPKGFVFQGDEVTYYGLCAECAKKG
jgi:Fur family ferric uptake transcriptional regulator